MSSSSDELYLRKAKKRELELLRQKRMLQEELPHIYGLNWYPWAWDFYTSTNTTTLLCAANQIGKSTSQIRKVIDWATDKSKWPDLWGREPNQFWYLYPSKPQAQVEVHKKWIPEFLPRGSMKNSPVYGWELEETRREVKAIHFNSGVSVYFKTYMQDPKTLQTGTVFYVACDEELPVEIYDELNMRLAGTGGYFSMVFTATIGQEFWWKALECQGKENEALKSAKKIQVSMYDCLKYIDGGETPWTSERIEKIVNSCKSPEEVSRRVYGRFVQESGRKYHAFSPSRHYCKPFAIPPEWPRYVGVDPGSGGQSGHPTGIVFIALKPDNSKGYVYKAWRGDGVETTAGDVFQKFVELRGDETMTLQVFDWAAKDFGMIAGRNSEGFTKAEKSHELGEEVLNTLFRNDMLMLFDGDTEIAKLGSELLSLLSSTPKQKAKDDLCDALRYPAVMMPWDYSQISGVEFQQGVWKKKEEKKKKVWTAQDYVEEEIRARRGQFADPRNTGEMDWEQQLRLEMEAWNEEYGN